MPVVCGYFRYSATTRPNRAKSASARDKKMTTRLLSRLIQLEALDNSIKETTKFRHLRIQARVITMVPEKFATRLKNCRPTTVFLASWAMSVQYRCPITATAIAIHDVSNTVADVPRILGPVFPGSTRSSERMVHGCKPVSLKKWKKSFVVSYWGNIRAPGFPFPRTTLENHNAKNIWYSGPG